MGLITIGTSGRVGGRVGEMVIEMEGEEVELLKYEMDASGGVGGEMVERDEVELKMDLMSRDGDDGAILRQEEDTPGTCFFRDENIW